MQVLTKDVLGYVFHADAFKIHKANCPAAAAEAFAAIKALQTCYSHIILKGDASQIMNGLQSKEDDLSELVPLFDHSFRLGDQDVCLDK